VRTPLTLPVWLHDPRAGKDGILWSTISRAYNTTVQMEGGGSVDFVSREPVTYHSVRIISNVYSSGCDRIDMPVSTCQYRRLLAGERPKLLMGAGTATVYSSGYLLECSPTYHAALPI
jgi:hypothetical protein